MSLKSLFFTLVDKRKEKHSTSIVEAKPPQPGHISGSHYRALAPEQSIDLPILSPAVLKQHQPMQPGVFMKTEHNGNLSSLGLQASTHLCRRRKEIPHVGTSTFNELIWSPLTSLSGKYAGIKHTEMKAKAFLCRTNQVWQLSCGGCQRDSENFGRNASFC